MEPQLLEDALKRRVLALWGSKLGVAAERRATVRTARGTLLLAAPAEALVAAADPGAYVADVADRAQGIAR